MLHRAACAPVAARLVACSATAGGLCLFTNRPSLTNSDAELYAHRRKEAVNAYENGFQGDQEMGIQVQVSELSGEAQGRADAPAAIVAVSPVSPSASANPAAINRATWEEPPKKRVAVYGGSFNPITNAHLNCAAEIIHSKLADEVWIVPCGTRPDKYARIIPQHPFYVSSPPPCC